MQRIPEKEVMDDWENARAYAEGDFSEPHEHFVDLLQARLPQTPKRILDIGCGAADIVLRVARRFPEAHITGLDASQPMLTLAKDAIETAQLESRIELHHYYLPNPLPIGTNAFDCFISNSLLHHLNNPADLWNAVGQMPKGAFVFVMDLMRPASEQEATQLTETYASNEPEVLQRDFYHSLFAAYEPEEVAQQLKKAGLHLNVETVSDRHLIVFGER